MGIQVAKERHGYNMEQALGMLIWHGYDFQRAEQGLEGYTPLPDVWYGEDKMLFEEGVKTHCGDLNRIRKELLPYISMGNLLEEFHRKIRLEDDSIMEGKKKSSDMKVKTRFKEAQGKTKLKEETVVAEQKLTYKKYLWDDV